MLKRLVLAAAAGALLSGAFEPVALVVLAPLALTALVLVLEGVPARRAWLLGLAFGVGFFFTLQWWMRAVGTDAWLGLSGAESVFMAPLASAWVLLRTRMRWWPLWTAVAWVALESVRSSWPFSGMPWGRLSYAVADSPWASGLPWWGFTGVSLLLATTGTVLAWFVLERPTLRRAAVPVAVLTAATVLPWVFTWPTGQEGTAVVAVVQGDVPGRGDDLVSVHREVTDNHVRVTEQLGTDIATGRVQAPDFVLWPENSTAVDPFRDFRARAGIRTAVDAVGVPVLVGGMVDDEDDDRVLNQGIVVDPVTGPGDRYTKWHPVPFGEYVPWRDLVFRNNLGRLQEIGRDMVSGSRAQPLRIGDLKVADAICFDIAYDDSLHAQLRGGAELVVVQTSNAMFIHTDQIDQQYAITRLRAIETGRAVAVAATNGVSGIIGPDGEVLVQADTRTSTALTHEVPLSARVTPSTLLGDWPGRLAVLVTLIALGVAVRRPSMAYIRRRPTFPSSEDLVL